MDTPTEMAYRKTIAELRALLSPDTVAQFGEWQEKERELRLTIDTLRSRATCEDVGKLHEKHEDDVDELHEKYKKELARLRSAYGAAMEMVTEHKKEIVGLRDQIAGEAAGLRKEIKAEKAKTARKDKRVRELLSDEREIGVVVKANDNIAKMTKKLEEAEARFDREKKEIFRQYRDELFTLDELHKAELDELRSLEQNMFAYAKRLKEGED
ncbi:MAG TPA: hypothetical protein ENH11_00485 [Candidatus Acetothermia bacterium]|nr:hypothetical protein [Candidatus Acetothermia bacterium]